ncbi:MAG: endolytic transglycosylase MltG [Clostridia bacterium]|nr:endolytic transglycosylase MltG [Clostridia bacterium]
MPENDSENRDIIASSPRAKKQEIQEEKPEAAVDAEKKETAEKPEASEETEKAAEKPGSDGESLRPAPKRAARRAPVFEREQKTRISEPVPDREQKTRISEPVRTQKNDPKPQGEDEKEDRAPVRDETRKHPAKSSGARKKKETSYDKPKIKDRGGITLGLIKAIIYIAAVLAISGFLGITGVKWGNDIFAFVKEETEATVVIPEFATVDEIADILKTNGLISEPSAFKFWVKFKYKNKNLVIVPGAYELKSTMNYDQMIYEIREKPAPRQIVEIKIPEGYTVDQIINLLVDEYHIGTREGFVKAINEYPYEYSFMEELNKSELSPNRKYRLEGYLFPAKYEVYSDISEVGIIDYFLSAFEKRFDKLYYDRLTELDMTLDEAITLASIIQAEGKFDSEFYTISSVFHNRLNSTDMKKLESDATINYYLPERKEQLSREDLETPNPYNSYLNEGLPPGAICNPGLEAIHAALYPDETKYFYFVADADGHSLFAETLNQHNKNKQTAAANREKQKEQIEAGADVE